jgi:hypothetical protein
VYQVSNVSKYQNSVSNKVHPRETSQKNVETFCTLDQIPEIALSLSSSTVWYSLSPREANNTRTTYANHSMKTELPNSLEPVIYKNQINIRNVKNAQSHIFVIWLYPPKTKTIVHQLLEVAKEIF